MSGEVDAALGKQEGSAVLIFDFQVQVFTHLNPDHMLSHICTSVLLFPFRTGCETETLQDIDGPKAEKTPSFARKWPRKCFLSDF